ncbi:hypothetical protein [Brevibacillus panacihumi]|uniref:hypothetical protein n=1 Tax=Brevibacillus panacihumi TaxID=497735 RepID=UPI003D1D199A
MAGNTQEVYRAVKRKIENEFRPRGLTVKSAGFKQDNLTEPLSIITGFWDEPNRVSSKPPRWIIQFNKNDGILTANFSKKPDGTYFPSSNTVGYINNREGNCAAIMFRIIASIKLDEEHYEFPDWEWVMLLVFNKPLPAGNSSETISNFNPDDKSIVYQRRSYKYSLLGIIKTNVDNETFTLQEHVENITYLEATNALLELLDNGNITEVRAI